MTIKFLISDYDFKQDLLYFGNGVRIAEPKTLRGRFTRYYKQLIIKRNLS